MAVAFAIMKNARVSAQKARLVVDEIRGRDIGNALSFLRFNNKKSAQLIMKVLESAVANAEHNSSVDVDDLYIQEIFVDAGFSMKRLMPRAKGRADRITKRTSNITVRLGIKMASGG